MHCKHVLASPSVVSVHIVGQSLTNSTQRHMGNRAGATNLLKPASHIILTPLVRVIKTGGSRLVELGLNHSLKFLVGRVGDFEVALVDDVGRVL